MTAPGTNRSEDTAQHLKLINKQRHVAAQYGVQDVTHADCVGDPEGRVDDEENQPEPGDRQLGVDERMNAVLEQCRHDGIDFFRAHAQQCKRKECIKAAEQEDSYRDNEQPLVVPVNVIGAGIIVAARTVSPAVNDGSVCEAVEPGPAPILQLALEPVFRHCCNFFDHGLPCSPGLRHACIQANIAPNRKKRALLGGYVHPGACESGAM